MAATTTNDRPIGSYIFIDICDSHHHLDEFATGLAVRLNDGIASTQGAKHSVYRIRGCTMGTISPVEHFDA